MGQLYLHPTHSFWKQIRRPECPVCRRALIYKNPVSIEWLEDGRYMVLHEWCAEPKTIDAA